MSDNPFADDAEAAFQPAVMFGKSYGSTLTVNATNNAETAAAAPPPAETSISFQDFQLGNEGGGGGAAFYDESMSSSLIGNAAGPGMALPTETHEANPFVAGPGSPASGEPEGPVKFWHISYYAGLFNVNTKEVVQRISRSMVPYPPVFFDMIKPNPDLYGPWWIATTLVFIIASTSNLSAYVKAFENGDTEVWQYDVTKMSAAAGTVYGYLGIIPLAFWAVQKYYKIGLKLQEIMCIYGYSFFIWLPISIACVEPNMIIRWVLTMGAGLLTSAFLVFNFWGPLKNDRKKGMIILLVMAALQMAFALVCQLYFFTSYS